MATDESPGRPAENLAALHFVVLDTLAGILDRADNVRRLGEFLTDLMREFSGARVAALLQFKAESAASVDRVVSVCPSRLEPGLDPATILRLARHEEAPPGTPAAGGPLPVAGADLAGSTLVLPLMVGERQVGAIVLLGLPEPEPHASAVRGFLEPLAGVIGLSLRNAALFEQQEAIIQQRTRALVEDIAERERISEALNWELGVNQALADLSNQLITGTNEPEVVADQILGVARALTKADLGFVLEIDPADGTADIYAQTDRPKHRITHDRLPRQADGRYEGLLGHCLTTREPFYTNEAARHPAASNGPTAAPPFRQFLAVPVVFGNELLGGVALADVAGGFRDRHLSALVRFAKFLALALQRRRVEAERKVLEQQLRHAQRLEAIGTLAGGIAHDFNNILTPILGEVQLALDDLDRDSPLHESLSRVETAATRAKDLVRQILAFSRKQEAARKPVPLDAALAEATRMLRSSLPSTIAIKSEVLAPGATVFADPGEIHQILMNLGVNAGQAMRDRPGRLEFRLERVAGDLAGAPGRAGGRADWACLTVSDTGIGMDAQTRDRIFEPYFTTKPAGEGTGLGLAVVHGVVLRYGGTIDVESEPGRGTTFRICLPLLSDAAQPAAAPAGATPGHGERILLVDDEPAIVDVGGQILRKYGYAVTSVTSSVEALEMFRASPDAFDLVISDQTLPQMTGVTMAKAMFAIRPELRLILMTGFSETLDERESAAIGAAALLMKPFTITGLVETVQKALSASSLRPRT